MLRIAMVTLAVAAVSGCTQRQSHDQYQELLSSGASVRQTALSDASGNSSASDLRAAAANVDQIRQQFVDVNPPTDVQQAHNRYVEALEGLHSVLNRLARCADMQVEDASQARECRAALNDRTLEEIDNDFGEADAIYTHAGYTLLSGSTGTETKDP